MEELTQALGEWDKVTIVVKIKIKIHFAGPEHWSNGGDGQREGFCSWRRYKRDAGRRLCLPLHEQVAAVCIFATFGIWYGR